MKLHKKAESLVGVVVAVVILMIAMFGIMQIMDTSRNVINNYNASGDEIILRENAINIASNLDLSNIEENEEFYIYNDRENKEYITYSGATNEKYKYVDKLGNYIEDINSFEGLIFERVLKKRESSLAYSIAPLDISASVLYLSADNINGQNNIGVGSGSIVSSWQNLQRSTNISSEVSTSIFVPGDDYNKIKFNGDDKFISNSSNDISGNLDCNIPPIFFTDKSFLFDFETGNDVFAEQLIYKQGDNDVGYSLYIKNSNLYLKANNNKTKTKYWCEANTLDYEWIQKEYIIEYPRLFPNTRYIITLVQDSNSLKLYVNGILYSDVPGITAQIEHQGFAIGGDTSGGDNYFVGSIMSVASWNYAMSVWEVEAVNKYMKKSNGIEYNSIEPIIKKYSN